jgi:hypothetical protein
MPKMMSPNTAIWWITDPTYDPLAPSAALLTDAANLSKAIVNGYTLNPTKSDVDTSTNITDTSKVETPVRYNYEGNLTFNRESDQTATTTAYARAFAFFKSERTTGFLVRRTGYLSDFPADAGQLVDSFKFINDVPKDVVEENLINFATKFSPQGVMELRKALVA